MFKLDNCTDIYQIEENSKAALYRARNSKSGKFNIVKIFKVPGMFYHEYEILKNLNEDCILKPIELKVDKNILIMEDFDGKTLEDIILKHNIDNELFLNIAIKMCDCLYKIHMNNVIHNNITLQSFMLSDDYNNVKIINFQDARYFYDENYNNFDFNMWKEELPYISPERTGRVDINLDYRTDFYSLGIIFYRMLTNIMPFSFEDPLELIYNHIAKVAVSPSTVNPAIEPMISNIVMKLISKDPDERYKSTYGIISDLKICLIEIKKNSKVKKFVLGKNDSYSKFQISNKLYGRQEEYKTIIEAYKRVEEGSCEIINIDGDSGLGKTFMMEEVKKYIIKNMGNFIYIDLSKEKINVPYGAAAYMYVKMMNIKWLNQRSIKDNIVELFEQALKEFLTEHSSLTIFIDDFQWIDNSSLKFLSTFISENYIRSLLIITAYKSGEREAIFYRNFCNFSDNTEKCEMMSTYIKLYPLNVNNIKRMILDTLSFMDTDHINYLSTIVMKNTYGNPRLAKQFLRCIYEQKILKFDKIKSCFTYDKDEIDKTINSDWINKIISEKFNAISENGKNILKIVAYIDGNFDIDILSSIMKISKGEILSELYKIMKKELIVKKKYSYEFINNEVREYIYSLLNYDEKKYVKSKIQYFLLNNVESYIKKNKIFNIVNHPEFIYECAKTKESKAKFCKMDLLAGIRLKNSLNFKYALEYLESGIKIFSNDMWDEYYNLGYNLYIEYAECEFLNRNYIKALKVLELLSHKTKNIFQKCKIYRLKIRIYWYEEKYDQVIKVGVSALNEFGVVIDTNCERKYIVNKMSNIRKEIKKKGIQKIDKLPIMKNYNMICALRIIENLVDVLYSQNTYLYIKLLIKGMEITLNYGISKGTPVIYLMYRLFDICLTKKYTKCYKYVDDALNVAKRFSDPALIIKLNCISLSTLGEYIKPIDENIANLSLIYIKCGIYGQLKYRYISSERLIYNKLIRGTNLETICNEIDMYIGDVSDNSETYTNILKYHKYKLYDLRNIRHDKHNNFNYSNKCTFIFWNEIYDIIVNYFLENYDSVIKNRFHFIGIPINFEYCFYYTMSLLAVYNKVNHETRKKYFKSITKNIKFICDAGQKIYCGNYLSQCILIKAELARIMHEDEKAARLYEKACRVSSKNKITYMMGLSYELFAKFYEDRGLTVCSESCMKQALHCYKDCGAYAKVEMLYQKYNAATDVNEYVASTNSKVLDLSSVIKASQLISSEIVMDRLLEKLMENVMVNAGAEKGCLIIKKDGKFIIEAQAQMDKNKTIKIDETALDESNSISISIVYYVSTTMKDVVLDNAYKYGKFIKDSHIAKNKVKSVLCTPIIYNGKLTGILYLENNIMAGAFNADRLEIIKFLSTQAAISIENAIMYKKIEELNKGLGIKVEEKTNELRKMVEKLKNEVKERKSAEIRLVKHEQMYRKVFEVCPAAIFVSKDKKIEFANKAAVRLIGTDCESRLIGKSIYDYINEECVKKIKKVLSSSANKDTENEIENQKLINDSGKELYVNVSAAPFSNQSNEMNICMMKDVTSKKLAEEMKKEIEKKEKIVKETMEYDKIRTEFFANISHELRTPLNIVLTAQQVLSIMLKDRKNSDDNKISEYMKTIRQNCLRLLRLINNLIDITKIDAGYYQICPENYDIVSTVENITLSVVQYAKANGIDIIFDTDVEEKILAFDPEKIERIILNLLSNAIKFTNPNGKIFVNIYDKKEFIKISVKDTGIGIPKDKQEVIFDRFVQVDKSLSRNTEGSGIGLSLVKSLVELHGGKISVVSQVGKGSEFIIMLPVKVLKENRSNDIYNNRIQLSENERIRVEFSDISTNI